MKIVITAEIREPLTEDEIVFLFDALTACGGSEIKVGVKELDAPLSTINSVRGKEEE